MLTKVIFEYSDGQRRSLKGEELQKWNRYNESVAVLAWTHNMNPPWEDVKWKEEGQIVNDEQKDTKENKEPESTGTEDKEAKRGKGGTISGGGL